jgi:hypothetical protein
MLDMHNHSSCNRRSQPSVGQECVGVLEKGRRGITTGARRDTTFPNLSLVEQASSNLPSIGLLKAKQELVSVTTDRRVEHIFGVIVGLVCKN